MVDINLFIHYYGTDASQIIFEEIVAAIISSGLFAELSRLTVLLSGDQFYLPRTEDLALIATKLRLLLPDEWGEGLETRSLRCLHAACEDQDEDMLVVYLHTKGATNYTEISRAWLTYMLDFNIQNWINAIHRLHHGNHDIYGASWCYADFGFDPKCSHLAGQLYGHFQGNFWWAKANYIRTLPKPLDGDCRYDAEIWVGLNHPKVFNVMCAPFSLVLAPYTREQYQSYNKFIQKDAIELEIPVEIFEKLKLVFPELFQHEIPNLTFDQYREGISWDVRSMEFTNALMKLLERQDHLRD